MIAEKSKIAILALTLFGPLAVAQEVTDGNVSGSRPGFGGPNATENQLADEFEITQCDTSCAI